MSKRDDQVRQVGTHTNEYNKVKKKKTEVDSLYLTTSFHSLCVQTNNSTAPLFKCYAICPVFPSPKFASPISICLIT